ncbi:MAG: glycoside hydrolase family 52 protein [Verrucomicrobiota bacterium]
MSTAPDASRTPLYNVQHSPIGAFASFTLGYPGAKGGLGLELGKPADESVFIGAESRDGKCFELFPFYEGSDDPSRRYDQNAGAAEEGPGLRAFEESEIHRELGLATDDWKAGDIEFRILTQFEGVPDPDHSPGKALKDVLVPAVWAELTVDNRGNSRPRRAVFGYQGSDPYSSMRCFEFGRKGIAVGQGGRTAIATRDRAVGAFQGFTLEKILALKPGQQEVFGLGGVVVLSAVVPPDKKKTFRFAVCFYRDGAATSGMDTSYYYRKWFRGIEDVADHALDLSEAVARKAAQADRRLASSGIGSDRQWMLAHAVHSYFGSTQFLLAKAGPFWVVNEGEYRMLNTFDLTVDQLFFEMKLNPWTVRNELEWFAKRFSYTDQVQFPGNAKRYPGGISFTHDMGIANAVSKPGTSSYECSALHGCFSHMTHEELVNWALCGLVYVKRSGDRKWARKFASVFSACLQSMARRDHPDDRCRNGVMSLDSSRCAGGSEITTYDSLDVSLGQARGNLYLAVKCWAAYVGLADLLQELRDAKGAALAAKQAQRCADTVAGSLRPDGYLPAVIGEGVESKIIPLVEGLVFPHQLGLGGALSEDGAYGHLIRAIKTHVKTVLAPGVCLFPDGGYKLSSTSDNSWLSKIYLCQFVIEEILGMPVDRARADAAHVSWLLNPVERYWAWSDQMINGVARGSKYYPRGVTSILWLPEEESGKCSKVAKGRKSRPG